MSSMESDYIITSTVIQEVSRLKYLPEELVVNNKSLIITFEENKACISSSEKQDNHRESKYIDYRHHSVREGVQRGDIRLLYVETLKQIADILTKALEPEKFIMFRDALVVSRNLLISS